jgi:hypothetical protein
MSKIKHVDWDYVQNYLEQNVDNKPGFTSKRVYNDLVSKIDLTNISYGSFQVELSHAMNDGRIVGFVGKRGKTGGIFKKGSVTVAESYAKQKVIKINNVTVKIKNGQASIKHGAKTMHLPYKLAINKLAEILIQDSLVGHEGDLDSLIDKINSFNL